MTETQKLAIIAGVVLVVLATIMIVLTSGVLANLLDLSPCGRKGLGWATPTNPAATYP
ncbi:hypothetical protein AAGW05_09595 [Arthrobacter sp. LAPM80]|uniref:hypothetical protein n=1 Tax=Arthrobacter sp. LAPM80 TaxID=3141788 RepID=UPI00398A981F